MKRIIYKKEDKKLLIKEGTKVSVLSEKGKDRSDGRDLWEQFEIIIEKGELCLWNNCRTPLNYFNDNEIKII